MTGFEIRAPPKIAPLGGLPPQLAQHISWNLNCVSIKHDFEEIAVMALVPTVHDTAILHRGLMRG